MSDEKIGRFVKRAAPFVLGLALLVAGMWLGGPSYAPENPAWWGPYLGGFVLGAGCYASIVRDRQ